MIRLRSRTRKSTENTYKKIAIKASDQVIYDFCDQAFGKKECLINLFAFSCLPPPCKKERLIAAGYRHTKAVPNGFIGHCGPGVGGPWRLNFGENGNALITFCRVK